MDRDTVPDAGCADLPSNRSAAALEMLEPDGHDVALVPDGYEHDASWATVGPNLVVRT